MSSFVRVAIHASQFPERVRRALVESLRMRQMDHRFHYDSVKQTQKWLALHQAYSPSRTDPDCAGIYERSFTEAVARCGPCAQLIGLGCGGGQKDTRLLKLLRVAGKHAGYVPVDVSTAMVLVARQTALGVIPPEDCSPLVCDLATADDLPSVLEQLTVNWVGRDGGPPAGASRLVSFFGMLPNFEPGVILPRLAALIRPGDHLLLSANLAPGPDYAAGVQRILPLYDNALTRDWLMTFLLDLGVEREDGEVHFSIEDDPVGSGLKRVTANFYFSRRRAIKLDDESFAFGPGESLRLFFSWRHTPAQVHAFLEPHDLQLLEQWVTSSEEEGVFLITRRQNL